MKTILSAVVLLASVAGFAKVTEVNAPQIMFGKYAVSVLNVCKTVDADGEVTLNGGMGEKCVKWKRQSDTPRKVCVETVPVELERSATYTKAKCGHFVSSRMRRELGFEQACRDIYYQTYTYDREYNVEVVEHFSRRARRENRNGKVVDSYTYSIPACN